MEEDFYTVIDVKSLAEALDVSVGVVGDINIYWRFKRKTCFNKPLLTPKMEEADILEKQQEDSLVAKMKMFVHLRQDLERVRNLCYMVVRREKTKRQYYRLREKVFAAQVNVMTDRTLNLSSREISKVQRKIYDGSIYDSRYINLCLLETQQQTVRDLAVSFLEQPQHKDKWVRKKQRFAREQKNRLSVGKSSNEMIVKHNSQEKLFSCDSANSKLIENCTESVTTSEPIEQVVTVDSKSTSCDIAEGEFSTEQMKPSLQSHHEKSKCHRRQLLNSFTEDHVNDSKENKPESLFITVADHVKQVKHMKSEEETISSEQNDPSPMKNQRINSEKDIPHPTRELRSATIKEEKCNGHSTARNVSEDIKQELNEFLMNSKLLVDKKLREKVQSRFMKSRKSRLKLMSGLSDRSQRKLNSYFRQCDNAEIQQSIDNDKSKEKSIKHTRINGKDICASEMQSTFKKILSNGTAVKANFSRYKIPKKSNPEMPLDKAYKRNGLISYDSYSDSGSKSNFSVIKDDRILDVQSPVGRISSRKLDSGLDFVLGNKIWMNKKSISRSREGSPDSTSSSLRSTTSYRTSVSLRNDSERIFTRSGSPMLVAMDNRLELLQYDGVDIVPRRVTRSQLDDN